MRPPVKFQWRGIHHGYVGIWFIAFGGFFSWLNIGNNIDGAYAVFFAVALLGICMVIDDLIEHLVTADTPMRIFYEKVLLPILS